MARRSRQTDPKGQALFRDAAALLIVLCLLATVRVAPVSTADDLTGSALSEVPRFEAVAPAVLEAPAPPQPAAKDDSPCARKRSRT